MWSDSDSDWDFDAKSSQRRTKPRRRAGGTKAVYRSPRDTATVLQVALGVWTIASGAYVGLCWVTLRLAGRVAREPWDVSTGQVTAHNDRRVMAAIVLAVLVLATAVLFISWMRRLHANLIALGHRPDRSERQLATAWFVPLQNLWEPKRIIDDLWRVSSHSEARGGVPRTIHLWWVSWVIGFFGSAAVFFAVGDPVDSIWDTRWLLLLSLVLLSASVLAWRVVRMLTARQIGAAAAAGIAGIEEAAEDRPWQAPALFAAGLVAAVVVAVVGSVAPSEVSLADADVGSLGATEEFNDYGVRFDYPAGYYLLRRFSPDPDSGMLEIYPWDKRLSIVVEWSADVGGLVRDDLPQVITLMLGSMSAGWDDADFDTVRLDTLQGREVGYATWRGENDGLDFSGATAGTSCADTDRALVVHAVVTGAAPAEEVMALIRLVLESADC